MLAPLKEGLKVQALLLSHTGLSLVLTPCSLFQKAMEDLGLKSAEICDILVLVAAVLKLGNIQFVPTTNMDGTEGCSIANQYGEKSLGPGAWQ